MLVQQLRTGTLRPVRTFLPVAIAGALHFALLAAAGRLATMPRGSVRLVPIDAVIVPAPSAAGEWNRARERIDRSLTVSVPLPFNRLWGARPSGRARRPTGMIRGPSIEDAAATANGVTGQGPRSPLDGELGEGTSAASGSGSGSGFGSGSRSGTGSGTGSALSPDRLAEILARIRAARRYPELARRRGIEGTVRLSFTVLGPGAPVVTVIRGADPALDEAAREAVLAAAPLPAIDGALEVELVFRLTDP